MLRNDRKLKKNSWERKIEIIYSQEKISQSSDLTKEVENLIFVNKNQNKKQYKVAFIQRQKSN